MTKSNWVQRSKLRFYGEREEALWAAIKTLPSDQISRVFDRYLEMMIEPIALNTNLVHEGIAEALVHLTNARRKITNQEREAVLPRLFTAMHGEREGLARLLMDLGIERNILFDMIHAALVNDEAYLPGVEPEPLRRHLSVLLADLEFFRAVVINRYIPLITKQSSNFTWGRRQNGLLIESEEAGQNYLLAAMRAVDKFDANSGTLTTYMANWLRNAGHSIFNLHLGESYSITRGVRSKIHRGEVSFNNHSVPLHGNAAAEHTVVEADEAQDSPLAELLPVLVQTLKANGLAARYRFGLLLANAPFTLSAEDITAQHATNNPEDSR